MIEKPRSRAEEEAIRTEWPLHNIMGSIDPCTPMLLKRRKSQRLAEINYTMPAPTPEQLEAKRQQDEALHCKLSDALAGAVVERQKF